MGSDHKEGGCLRRLNVAFSMLVAEKAGHCPGLFFAGELLYKAHDRRGRQSVL